MLTKDMQKRIVTIISNWQILTNFKMVRHKLSIYGATLHRSRPFNIIVSRLFRNGQAIKTEI